MSPYAKPWLAAMGALMLALIAEPADARPSHRDNGTMEQSRAQPSTAIDQNAAAALVQRATGGRVLGIETTNQGGRTVHRVKVLLPGGRVSTVSVDASTGQTY